MGPLKQRLPLPTPPIDVATAVHGYLSRMPTERLPPLDLPNVIVAATAKVEAAVPLEPAQRILRMDPATRLPFRQWRS